MKNRSFHGYVAFGSNVGPRQTHLEKALRRLSQTEGVQLLRVSPLYETEPVGGPEQRRFYNGVCKIKTTLSPQTLFQKLRAIETAAGRVRRKRWGPRTLDLDLLLVDRVRLRSPQLTLPHPRYHLRRFVLVPLVKLAPQLVHPIIRKKNKTLLRELTLLGQRVTMVGPWKKFRFHSSKKRKKPKSLS